MQNILLGKQAGLDADLKSDASQIARVDSRLASSLSNSRVASFHSKMPV
jgi:hypothetical protein